MAPFFSRRVQSDEQLKTSLGPLMGLISESGDQEKRAKCAKVVDVYIGVRESEGKRLHFHKHKEKRRSEKLKVAKEFKTELENTSNEDVMSALGLFSNSRGFKEGRSGTMYDVMCQKIVSPRHSGP